MTDSLLSDPILRDLPVNAGWKVIGPVALEKKLGQGGMGAVYKGRHLRLNVPVAVKLMSQHLSAGERQFAERFRREAQVAVTLNHPNLVRCFDVNTELGVNYMILEFIQGEDAGHRVKRKGAPGLPEKEACAIVAGAAAGLVEAHRRGIVHRDIKPENIMVDHSGRVVLMDLGLAKIVEDPGDAMTVTGQAMGTPNYMSPEQWDDAKSAGLPSDIWALGVTLYVLATGSVPWSASGMGLLMKKVQNEPMEDPRKAVPALSEPVIRLIERCLQKAPGLRISAAELHRELKAVGGEAYDLTDPAVVALPDSSAGLPAYPTPSALSAAGPSSGQPAASTVDGPTVQIQPAGSRTTGSTDPTLIAQKRPKIPGPVRDDLAAVYKANGNRIPSGSQIDALAHEWGSKHGRHIESNHVFGWFQTYESETHASPRGMPPADRAPIPPDNLTPGSADWGRQNLSALIDTLVRENIATAKTFADRKSAKIAEVVRVRLRESLGRQLSAADQAEVDSQLDAKIQAGLNAAPPVQPGCFLMGLHPVLHLGLLALLGLAYWMIPLFAGKEDGVASTLWVLSVVMVIPNILGLIGGMVLRSRLGPSAVRFYAMLLLIASFWFVTASGCMLTFLMYEEVK